MKDQVTTIIAIGGWDTSGGAGLTRDTQVTSQLQAHLLPVATLVSLQTHTRARGAELMSPELFAQQLECLAGEPVAAIKVGALGCDAQIDSLLAWKQQYFPEVPLVWDPVMVTTSGGQLGRLSHQAVAALLAQCTLVTPNLEEMYALAQTREHAQAVKIWQQLGAAALLVTGMQNNTAEVTDILYTATAIWHFGAERRKCFNVRGTGCTLASAVAVALARHYALHDAVCLARAQMQSIFTDARPVANKQALAGMAQYRPAPDSFGRVQRDGLLFAPDCRFPPLTQPHIGLYPVIDDVSWLPMLIEAGVTTVQLRIKQASSPHLRQQIQAAVALCYPRSIQLFINDHWQLAIEAGAYGVHLGQDDLTQASLDAIAAAGMRVGISTHGYAELCRVLPLRPSYIALGHVFATTTKKMPSSPQGTRRLARYRALCDDIPAVAIGGINLTRLPAIQQAGVNNVAVVSAITQADTPTQVIADFQQALHYD